MNRIESFLTSMFVAFIVGWFANLTGLVTDSINLVSYQALIKLGWIGVIFVIAFVIKQTYDDFVSYVAMGVFAIFAVITLFSPFDLATLLFAISFLSLGIFIYLGILDKNFLDDLVLRMFGK